MRPDELFLRDILAADAALGRFLQDADADRLRDDELLQAAVLQKLTVIGEAAGRISAELKAAHPDVE